MSEAPSEPIEYLAPNEKILWQSQSKGRSSATLAVRPIVLAAIATFGVGLMLIYFGAPGSTLNLGRGIGLPWSLLLIVSVSFGPLAALFAWRGRQDRLTCYLVTTSSAMIIGHSGRLAQRATILPLSNLTTIKVIKHRNGTGTLYFNFGSRDPSASDSLAETPLAFLNIEQPLDVYQLIRQQMAKG